MLQLGGNFPGSPLISSIVMETPGGLPASSYQEKDSLHLANMNRHLILV